MSKPPKSVVVHRYQSFEFLLETTEGTEAFIYSVLLKDADRLEESFSAFSILDDGGGIVEFPTASGRIIHLNLKFLVAACRLNVLGPADGPMASGEKSGDLAGWASIAHPKDPPDVVLFVHGIKEPVVLPHIVRGEVELAASVLEAEPRTALLSLRDLENLRTRFIPTRNVIVMDRRAYRSKPG